MSDSIGNNLWPKEAHDQLLHVLPLAYEHGTAEIRGTPKALKRLAEALLKASELPQTEHVDVDMMASDGEGYGVLIYPMSEQQIDDSPLPYAQLGHDYDFERCWNCPKKRSAAAPDETGIPVDVNV